MTKAFQAYSRFLENLPATRQRYLRSFGKTQGSRITRDGKTFCNFSSNNYLGLAQHQALRARAIAWTEAWGTGTSASRLVCGNLDLFERVEAKLAKAKRKEAALLMASGYQTNVTVLATLLNRRILGAEPLVYCDALNHASIHQGCQSAGVRQIRYRHNDLDHLESRMAQDAQEKRPRFILTESVFSMDGDRPDLDRLVEISTKYDAFLYLDEAHAMGVLGPDGFGLAAEYGDRIDMVMGTFSKALGSFGAYVACSARLRGFLINRCPGLIYSTGLPPAVLGANDAALDLVPKMAAERAWLQGAAERVRHAFHDAGLDIGGSTTQIIPVIVGSEEKALRLSAALERDGLLGVAIRPPSVSVGESRIRFTITAAHADDDIDRLIESTVRAARDLRIVS
ncbi:8-amino-7-oxononanoate synthase [Rhodospirillaceae bacterium AH-315-P19]|nr:8-amino-7-oxononanoate synthase [Rhodospirillaceae bacterium AH-315-P19]